MFYKVRFCSNFGATAGLVIEAERLSSMTISEISKFFPITEATKMHLLEVSPRYATRKEAFEHQFTLQ